MHENKYTDTFLCDMFANQIEILCSKISNETNAMVKINYQIGNNPESTIIVHPNTEKDTTAKKEKKGSSNIVATLMRYINENLHGDLSLSSLAEKVNYHPSYLSRLFKQKAGTNPSAYILNARINKAKELLHSGKLQVNKVAQTVGYSSSHSFTRIFKFMTGLSPQEYKNSKITEELK